MDDADEKSELHRALGDVICHIDSDGDTHGQATRERTRSSLANPDFHFDDFKQTTPSIPPLPLADSQLENDRDENEEDNFCHDADCPLNDVNRRGLSSGSPKCKVYVKSNMVKDGKEKKLVFVIDTDYIRRCDGIVKIIQIVLSMVTLIMLSMTGREEGGILHLPLSWHFRVMLFVLILSILTSILLLLAHVINIISLLPVDWIIFDLVLYSVLSFLYLVGTSLVASAFDFYNKMNSNVSKTTINQLVVCVILGYICMLCYGLTGVASFRTWRIQHNLYQRKRLIDEEELDI